MVSSGKKASAEVRTREIQQAGADQHALEFWPFDRPHMLARHALSQLRGRRGAALCGTLGRPALRSVHAALACQQQVCQRREPPLGARRALGSAPPRSDDGGGDVRVVYEADIDMRFRLLGAFAVCQGGFWGVFVYLNVAQPLPGTENPLVYAALGTALSGGYVALAHVFASHSVKRLALARSSPAGGASFDLVELTPYSLLTGAHARPLARVPARALVAAHARNSAEWAFVHLPGWRMPHAIDREGGATLDARALADLSAARPVVGSDRDGVEAGADGAAGGATSARVGPGTLRRQRRARGRDGGGGRA